MNAKFEEDLPGSAPKDALKASFSNKLNQLMLKKGWTQADMAREATKHSQVGTIGRDRINCYVKGRSLPTPLYLKAIAAALRQKPEDLLPPDAAGMPGAPATKVAPPFDIKDLGDGRVWLRINKAVPFQTAMSIMGILSKLNE
jgi:transcriptional regulator with XRE-family HTH domain